MRKLLLTSILLILPSMLVSQEAFKKIPTRPNKIPVDYYAWVVYVNEGETKWVKEEVELAEGADPRYEGTFFRVAITLSEIYSTLIIEKLRQGNEGSGRRIIASKDMDTYKFVDSFNIFAEFAGLEFVSWESYDSFKFTIKSRVFLVTDIDSDTLKISEIISDQE